MSANSRLWSVVGLWFLGCLVAIWSAPVFAGLFTTYLTQGIATRLAATATLILILTIALLRYAQKLYDYSESWLFAVSSFTTCLILIKFLISPGFFSGSPHVTLANYLAIGIVIMLVYLGSFAVVSILFQRQLPRTWNGKGTRKRQVMLPVVQTGAIVLGAAALVYILRLLELTDIFPVLKSTSYLYNMTQGVSFVLPAFIAMMAFFAVSSFQQSTSATSKTASTAGLANFYGLGMSLIALIHILWAVNMAHLFI
jgi:hypothetical protein